MDKNYLKDVRRRYGCMSAFWIIAIFYLLSFFIYLIFIC